MTQSNFALELLLAYQCNFKLHCAHTGWLGCLGDLHGAGQLLHHGFLIFLPKEIREILVFLLPVEYTLRGCHGLFHHRVIILSFAQKFVNVAPALLCPWCLLVHSIIVFKYKPGQRVQSLQLHTLWRLWLVPLLREFLLVHIQRSYPALQIMGQRVINRACILMPLGGRCCF